MEFSDFFTLATKIEQGPYPYQVRFATGERLPDLLSVPTGVGKTATTILGWLYRRCFAEKSTQQATPRRLVYCLPMRTLVEQTEKCAKEWTANLVVGGKLKRDEVKVHLLMGGVDRSDWDEWPERNTILIGTQDMLLSRALNRGYGMSRYRWPMHFGWLNNDCLWVFDETQLMGVGLITSAQLHGFRTKLTTFGSSHSIWMSATLETKQLMTVDHPEPVNGYETQALSSEDRKNGRVKRRLVAKKSVAKSKVGLTPEAEKKGYAKELAVAIQSAHQPLSLTLVVVNRVARSQDIFTELHKLKKKGLDAELAIIHARFRPSDRKNQEERLFDKTLPAAGRIVVATQAIEAGVDVSAKTMFTELAPWPSLVQRFGRCNRGGEFSDASIQWIDIRPKDEKDRLALPYQSDELVQSRKYLAKLDDVGPSSLESIEYEGDPPTVHTIRRKDLLDLWDTTPDLSGNDLDVSRFIRDANDTDVQVFWRTGWNEEKGEKPGDSDPLGFPAPEREELCSVPVFALSGKQGFLAKIKERHLSAWKWNPLEKRWEKVGQDSVRAGMTILLHAEASGYSAAIGWTGDHKGEPVSAVELKVRERQEAYEDDDLGNFPVELLPHLATVAKYAAELRDGLANGPQDIPWEAMIRAAWWHDVGKLHPAFRAAMFDGAKVLAEDPDGSKHWAKSGEQGLPKYRMPDGSSRRGFRHELASALAWLANCDDKPNANLIAFLIAAHHGKVRQSLRSMPNEMQPADERTKFARGVWDGDELPAFMLGNGDSLATTKLDLSLMMLGESNGKPSWLARVLALRDEFGPFRLSYLETLLRVADWRGSRAGGPMP